MNTSYTSQLQREFDNMALLSDIQSPVPNFITTGNPPKRQRSLQDNENLAFFKMENAYPKKQQKVSNTQTMAGGSKVNVVVKQTGERKEIELDDFKQDEHMLEDDFEDLATHDFTRPAGQKQHLLIDPDDTLNQSNVSNMFDTQSMLDYIAEKNDERGFGKPKPPINGINWEFAQFITSQVHSGSLSMKMTELGQTFCYFCMGFGHSKHDCLTQKKSKEIFRGLPMSARLNFIVNQVLQSDTIVQTEYDKGMSTAKKQPWVLFKIVKQYALHEVRKDSTKTHIAAILSSVVSSLASISVQCKYCQGYGHKGTDDIVLKQPKGTKVVVNDKSDKQVKTKTSEFYSKQKITCKTKVRFEQAIVGEFASRQQITAALSAWSAQQKYKTTTTKDNLVSLEGLIGATDTMKKNTVQAQRLVEQTDVERLTRLAILSGTMQKEQEEKFEKKQKEEADRLKTIEQNNIQTIDSSPKDFFMSQEQIELTLDCPSFASTKISVAVEKLLKEEVKFKEYKPLTLIYSIVVLQDELVEPVPNAKDIPAATVVKMAVPFFWFSYPSTNDKKKLRSEVLRFVRMSKHTAFEKADFVRLGKDETQAGPNFRFWVYVLSQSLYTPLQLLTLRALCKEENAFEFLVYLIVTIYYEQVEPEVFTATGLDEDKAGHEFKIGITEEFLSALGMPGDMGVTLTQTFPLYKPAEAAAIDANPLFPAAIKQAHVLKTGEPDFSNIFKYTIEKRKAELKGYYVDEKVRMKKVRNDHTKFQTLLLAACGYEF